MMDFDLTPLYRSVIGFDRMIDLMQNASRYEPGDNYPPCDIEKKGEDAYRITMAVAGFAPDELSITAQQNLLAVSGQKHGDDNATYLHHGLAARAFERRFELADFVYVKEARLEHGLLAIDLARELPDAMKPRQIAITTDRAAEAAAGKTIEHDAV